MGNRKKVANHATSAQVVASIDDLLTQILLLLPIKSLLRFISVSKHWLSLIRNPEFSLHRNPNPDPALGLFLQRTAYRRNPTFEYFPFSRQTPHNPPFRNLNFLKESFGLRILQSCKGLFLCSSFQDRSCKRKNYYVCNPTTKQFIKLPELFDETHVSKRIRGLSLAFDPTSSPHYRVISVSSSDDMESGFYQIEIYCSQIKAWRNSGKPFAATVNFDCGTYWNGSIHWINDYDGRFNHLCYNVDKELISRVSTPLDWNEEFRPTHVYIGESCDHLHLVETEFWTGRELTVYELKRDYSEWFVKYQVNIGGVFEAYHWRMRSDHPYLIRSLIRGEREEDSFLVMEIRGMILRLNIVDDTFEGIYDFEDAKNGKFLSFHWTKSFEYIESLYSV